MWKQPVSISAALMALAACQPTPAECPEVESGACPECLAVEPTPAPPPVEQPVKKRAHPHGHEPVEIAVKVPMVSLSAKPGQRVFAPHRSSFKKRSGTFDIDLDMYTGILREVGKHHSLVENDTMAVGSIPNVFIVPVPEGERAKPGDVILLHHDQRSMGEKALVVAGGTPAAPMARGVTTWSPRDPEVVKEGSFIVLSAWGPGTVVACKTDNDHAAVTVVRIVDEQIIGLDWGDDLRLEDKSDCQAAPVRPTVKVGQLVWAAIVGDFIEAKVLSVDEDAGNVEVEYKWGNKTDTRKIAFGEILTTPPQ